MHRTEGLIISAMHNVAWWRRIFNALATLLLWLVWVYLWLPLLLFLGVLLGWVKHMPFQLDASNWVENRWLLLDYLAVVVFIGGCLLLWAATNLWRFGGSDRRQAIDPVSNQELADDLQMPLQQLALAQGSKICIVRHLSDGWVSTVEVVQPLAATDLAAAPSSAPGGLILPGPKVE